MTKLGLYNGTYIYIGRLLVKHCVQRWLWVTFESTFLKKGATIRSTGGHSTSVQQVT